MYIDSTLMPEYTKRQFKIKLAFTNLTYDHFTRLDIDRYILKPIFQNGKDNANQTYHFSNKLETFLFQSNN